MIIYFRPNTTVAIARVAIISKFCFRVNQVSGFKNSERYNITVNKYNNLLPINAYTPTTKIMVFDKSIVLPYLMFQNSEFRIAKPK